MCEKSIGLSNIFFGRGPTKKLRIRSSFILQATYPRFSVMPMLAGPSVRRPPGMWRSPSRPPAVVVVTWLEGHTRGMAPVVAKPGSAIRATSTLAYSKPSPSSHGSEMVRLDRMSLILTKPNQTPNFTILFSSSTDFSITSL